MTSDITQLADLIAKHPKLDTKIIDYAVSGVRGKASTLDYVVFRTGLLAALRSWNQKGLVVGLMITASHNPVEDNGVKLIDTNGEMMENGWVRLATELLNVPDDQLIKWVNDALIRFKPVDGSNQSDKQVFIGQDTRPSSMAFAQAAEDGVRALNGHVTQYGLLTTPQLHFIVHKVNNAASDTRIDEQVYYQQISSAFNLLCESVPSFFNNYKPQVYLDCANGVGAPQFLKLQSQIHQHLQVQLFNTGKDDGDVLNLNCGADYVKLEQRAPAGLQMQPNHRYASFDGDADRIVYFFAHPIDNRFVLIDGDKIAVLIALYLQKLLQETKLDTQLSCSVVQTAYANGSSTNYLVKQLGIQVHCVATGILNLQTKAAESDVGICFEANGHGTVLFNRRAIDLFQQVENVSLRAQLNAFVELINQTCGDAISDLLVSEIILRRLDWSELEWSQLYTDLPQRQLKVKVADRSVFKVTPNERQCVEPIGLQTQIDQLVESYGGLSRSFVRPSQTEDIVRVYAESDSQDKADQLAGQVAKLVEKVFKK